MLKSFMNGSQSMLNRRDALRLWLPFVFIFVCAVVPMAASCQRSQGETDRGISDLRTLVEASSGKPAATELSRIESKYSNTKASSLARFLRGYLAYSSRDYQAAIDALDPKPISAHSALADYALFYRAESLAALNSKPQARRDYEDLYTDQKDSLRARDAQLKAAEAAIATGDPTAAIKDLTNMVEAKDADAIFITAQAYEAMGRNDDALKLYRRIYYEVPATTVAVKVEERLSALGASPATNPGSSQDYLSRANALYESKQYFEASKAFETLLTLFPDMERMDEVQLRRGVSMFLGKQPAQAVLPLAKVSNRNENLYTEALFYQAEALRQSNRAGESSVVVDRLLREYPKSRRAETSLYNLASYLNRQDRKSEASVRYRQLIATYPKSQYAAEASWNLGWQAYLGKNYADAARLLEQHLLNYSYPDTKYIGEAAFWGGKSQEVLGNRARALALYQIAIDRYPFGYHGHLARVRSATLRSRDPQLKPEQAKPGSDIERMRQNALYVESIKETANGPETSRLAKADDLETIGLGELAVKEINRALEDAPESPKLNLRLASYYSRRGDPFQATLVLRRGYPDIYSYKDEDLPREAWEIFFPMVEWQTIKQEARRYSVDPYTAAGLIRQESVFNPNAVSKVGARGLMQLMPETGRLVAKRQGSDAITSADLFNPQLNIKLGMNYLAQMLGQFGRIEYAAAAYNAGPGRAKRWIAERGHLDMEDWIESIPFTETRGYVQGVLRYTQNYRRFYKD
jgi:soluble lytic murein transglycosylase